MPSRLSSVLLLLSSCIGEIENVSANQRLGRGYLFFDQAQKANKVGIEEVK